MKPDSDEPPWIALMFATEPFEATAVETRPATPLPPSWPEIAFAIEAADRVIGAAGAAGADAEEGLLRERGAGGADGNEQRAGHGLASAGPE